MASRPPTSPAPRRPAREKPQQIADELRQLIVRGELNEGDSLGREPDLVERFGVSRPSLREALRILEAEGLISVRRGATGGVVVHAPDERVPARNAAMVLQARGVPLADVYHARSLLELVAVRAAASGRPPAGVLRKLRDAIEAQAEVVEDHDRFAGANATFHDTLVEGAGNRTFTFMAQMLNEIVAHAVSAAAYAGSVEEVAATQRRGIRSQQRLLALIEAGDAAAAEDHWRRHLAVVGRLLLGERGADVVDLTDPT